MFDAEHHQPIEEGELRQMLAELDVEVDAAILPRMLAAVQPIRARLRTADAGQRRALLHGAATTAAGGPPGQRRPSRSPVEPAELPRTTPTLGNLISRLVGIFFAMVAGSFALITIGTPVVSLGFGAVALLLLFAAVTGWGSGNSAKRPAARTAQSTQSPDSPARRARRVVGPIIGILLLYVTGIGHFLLLSVRSVFDPRFHAEGDVITRALQMMGLLVIVIVISHVIRARRREAR